MGEATGKYINPDGDDGRHKFKNIVCMLGSKGGGYVETPGETGCGIAAEAKRA